jgi:hypothetical protein
MRLYVALGRGCVARGACFSNGKWQISFIGFAAALRKNPALFRDRDANCAVVARSNTRCGALGQDSSLIANKKGWGQALC